MIMNLSTSCTRLVAWMCLSMVTFPLLSRSETESGIMQTPTPIRFDQPDASRQWVTVNDNVMGGRSIGDFTIKEGNWFLAAPTPMAGDFPHRSRPLERDMSAVAAFVFAARGTAAPILLSHQRPIEACRSPIELPLKRTQASGWRSSCPCPLSSPLFGAWTSADVPPN